MCRTNSRGKFPVLKIQNKTWGRRYCTHFTRSSLYQCSVTDTSKATRHLKIHGKERSRTSWESNSAPSAQTGPRTNQLSAEFFIVTILMGTFLPNLITALFSTTRRDLNDYKPPFYFVPLRQGRFHLVKFPSVLGNVSLKKSNWFIMEVCTWLIFLFFNLFLLLLFNLRISSFLCLSSGAPNEDIVQNHLT